MDALRDLTGKLGARTLRQSTLRQLTRDSTGVIVFNADNLWVGWSMLDESCWIYKDILLGSTTCGRPLYVWVDKLEGNMNIESSAHSAGNTYRVSCRRI